MGPVDIVVLFGAALWGALVGGIAAAKRRSFGGWFLLGTAGAFVGIVVAFVNLPRAADPADRTIFLWMSAIAFLGPLIVAVILRRVPVAEAAAGPAPPRAAFAHQAPGPRPPGPPPAALPASQGEGWRVYPSRVNGLDYPTPDTGASRLDYAARALRPGDALQLVAEPDNPYDPDAVAIRHAGFHLGYVPARHDWVKRSLDEGDEHLARVARLRRDPASGALEAVEIEIAVRDGA